MMVESEIKKLRNRKDLDGLANGDVVRINDKGCNMWVLFKEKKGEEYYFKALGTKKTYIARQEDMSFEDGGIIINRQGEKAII